MKRKRNKPKSTPTRRRGRPLIVIDWEIFDALCKVQCTLEELASFFHCSADTIERACEREKGEQFAEYIKARRGDGRVSLRRAQFQSALAGDKTMLIWLGKQYLGQSDKIQAGGIENAPPIGVKVEPMTEAEAAEIYRRELKGGRV